MMARKAVYNGTILAAKTLTGRLDIGTRLEVYENEYTATSRPFEEYELPTKSRFLVKNITVKKIPYFETSNTSGGTTAYIGTEVMINHG